MKLTDLINGKSFNDENYEAIPPESISERDKRFIEIYRMMLPPLVDVMKQDREQNLNAQQSALNILRCVLLTVDRAIELATAKFEKGASA